MVCKSCLDRLYGGCEKACGHGWDFIANKPYSGTCSDCGQPAESLHCPDGPHIERTEEDRVSDILSAADRIRYHTRDLSKEDLIRRPITRDAVLRQLCIVSEAALHLSPSFREKHPTVRWTKIIETGTAAISRYREMDFDAVWEIVTRDVPALAKLSEIELTRPRGRR
jgi:uncharacterized protein with HEPN domain